MTWARGRWLSLTVGVAAVGLLVASIVWTATAGGGWGRTVTQWWGRAAWWAPVWAARRSPETARPRPGRRRAGRDTARRPVGSGGR
jgi:hypothetical protein